MALPAGAAKRSPHVSPFADREQFPAAPSCRLPSPHRVPACPVRDTSQRPYPVKAAQEGEEGGGGALALALTGYGMLSHPAREVASLPFLLLDDKRVAPLLHNGGV